MADPRSATSFIGIGYEAETFGIDNATITYSAAEPNGSAQVGLAVTYSDAKTVQLVGDGELVVGKLVKVESDNLCVVQTGGHVTLPGGDAATLTQGAAIVGDLGPAAAEGYIRAVASAQAAELAVARGQIVDPDTATAVVVRLESAT